MKPDRKADPAFDTAWLDIPDPVRHPIGTRATAVAAPRAPSLDRRQVHRRRLTALTLSVVWPIVIVAVWGLRHDAGDIFGFLAGQSALWMALLVVSAAASVARGRRGLGAPIAAIELAVIGAPAVFLPLALVWLPEGAGDFAGIGTLKQLGACVGLGLLVLLPMLAVSTWALRRAFPSGAIWRGGALGAACGLAGAIVLTLHCGITIGGHIALAHGGPIVLAALFGTLAGSKLGRA